MNKILTAAYGITWSSSVLICFYSLGCDAHLLKYSLSYTKMEGTEMEGTGMAVIAKGIAGCKELKELE